MFLLLRINIWQYTIKLDRSWILIKCPYHATSWWSRDTGTYWDKNKMKQIFTISKLKDFLYLALKIRDYFFNKNFSIIRSDSHLPKKFVSILKVFIGIPLKVMKNALYFILKAVFVLKIFKFLSWISGHVEKTAGLER